ncbi:MAG: hypothetical protein A3G34_12250 [Candidatus Lindowbacteria bacterium RIFCSPLOWO2_12_FULL_62_27]|nr:MAG: hypothetical protein A3G34_12250 [Candidatus Lindowbacteria bacterium RIFCSPLOWO2_12_FULL_62_27]OGH63532.1 MAG: hypothetical protein A3I06_05135 [Candidatus Lindowbacteria bacterium RIFCSPLOWO2_02_FULL_62_12]
MARKFSDLTPEEVLRVAIGVEIANGERLRTFADMFSQQSPEASSVFKEMAEEEDQHKAVLVARYAQIYAKLADPLPESEISDVLEAHDLQDAEHFIFDDMDARAALKAVLAAENVAMDFYRRAVPTAATDELRAVYAELADGEADHVRRVQERLAAQGMRDAG